MKGIRPNHLPRSWLDPIAITLATATAAALALALASGSSTTANAAVALRACPAGFSELSRHGEVDALIEAAEGISRRAGAAGKVPARELGEFSGKLRAVSAGPHDARESQIAELTRQLLGLPVGEPIRVHTLQAAVGGEAEVHLARLASGEEVIVKVFSEPGLRGHRRLVRELSVAKRLGSGETPGDLSGVELRAIGKTLEDGNAHPVLVMEKAPGRSFQDWVAAASRGPNELREARDAAREIGDALADFHVRNTLDSPSRGARAAIAEYRRREHLDKIGRWLERDAETGAPALLDTLREKGWLTEPRARELRRRLEALFDEYGRQTARDTTVAHADLKPANVFVDLRDGGTARVTAIDNETMARTLPGLSDPMEDLGRLVEGVKRQGVLAGLDDSAISLIQESVLRGYFSRSPLLRSDSRVALDFYRARYVGALLRRDENKMDAGQSLRMLEDVLPGYRPRDPDVSRFEELAEAGVRDLAEIDLPTEIAVRLDHSGATRAYATARAYWESFYDPRRLAATLEKLAEVGNGKARAAITKDDLRFLRATRKRIRLVRAVFVALGEDHRSPEAVHRFTKTLGDLNDLIENGAGTEVRKPARRILAMMREPELEHALDGFRAASAAGFRRYLNESLGTVRALSGRDELSATEFHDLRKEFQRMQGVLRLSQIADPDAARAAAIDYVALINKYTGRVHDELVQGHLAGRADYDHARVRVPADLRALVEGFAGRVRTGVDRPADAELRARLEALLHAPYRPLADLPEVPGVAIRVEKEDARRYFDLSVQLWHGENSVGGSSATKAVDELRGLSAALDSANRAPARNELRARFLPALKEARKRLMLLRYLFIALDAKHEKPAAIHALAQRLGAVNDVLASDAGDLASATKRALAAGDLAAVDAEIRAFRPASAESTAKFLRGRLVSLREGLRGESVPAPRFHAIRKELRLIQALLRVAHAADEAPGTAAVIDRIHAINEATGRIHDDLVARSLADEIDYAKQPVRLPSELRYEIDRVVESLRF